MERANQGKAWPLLGPFIFAGVFLVYALGLPLGLAKVEGAFALAGGLSMDPSGLSPVGPFDLLTIRLMAYLPLGDFGLRGNLASCLWVSIAVACMGRFCIDILVSLRPSREARQGWRDFLYEPIAAVGASLTAAFGLASYEFATTVGPSAFTLLLVVLAWRHIAPLIRQQRTLSYGLSLAALTGFASSAEPVAVSLLYPVLIGIGLWSLRKGERWPLLLPCVFLLAFGGSILAVFAAASTPLSLSEVLTFTAASGIRLWPVSAMQLIDSLGVIGCLLACIGFLVLFSHQFVLSLWILITLLTAWLFTMPTPTGVPEFSRLAFALTLLICAPVVACGIFHVSAKMGRARVATAMTLSILALMIPALEGGSHRWGKGILLPVPLLEKGLAKAAPRSVIEPGSLAMSGLFRLGQVWGLRPDLVYSKNDSSYRKDDFPKTVENSEE